MNFLSKQFNLYYGIIRLPSVVSNCNRLLLQCKVNNTSTQSKLQYWKVKIWFSSWKAEVNQADILNNLKLLIWVMHATFINWVGNSINLVNSVMVRNTPPDSPTRKPSCIPGRSPSLILQTIKLKKLASKWKKGRHS